MNAPATLLRLAVGLAGVLGVLATPARGAETYRWVDESGRVTYSDRPPPDARKAVSKRFDDAPADAVPTYAARKAAADFPVELYTSENCGELCGEARSFLAARGVPFSERKLATEDDAAAYRARFGAPEDMPAISVGNRTDKGYERGRWTRMLDDAGYPKAPPPPR